jgi:hypothetical protein
VNIVSGPDGQVTGPDVEIVFSIDDLPNNRPQAGEVVFTCTLDDGEPEVCTSPKWYRGLPPGDHAVVISATDDSGDRGSARVGFTVASSTGDPDDPAVVSSAGADAPEAADPTSVGGVLAYTGDHVTEIATVGLLLVLSGVMLGSLAAFARRRSN